MPDNKGIDRNNEELNKFLGLVLGGLFIGLVQPVLIYYGVALLLNKPVLFEFSFFVFPLNIIVSKNILLIILSVIPFILISIPYFIKKKIIGLQYKDFWYFITTLIFIPIAYVYINGWLTINWLPSYLYLLFSVSAMPWFFIAIYELNYGKPKLIVDKESGSALSPKEGRILENINKEHQLALGLDVLVHTTNKMVFKKIKPSDAIYLGQSFITKKYVYWDKYILNQGTHIVGASGSGKSSFLERIIEYKINSGMPIVILDAKGESKFIRKVYGMCKDHGREDDFRLFSLKHSDSSCTFNPFFSKDSGSLNDRITSLIEWSEVYYKSASRNFYSFLLMALVETGKAFSMSDIINANLNITILENIIASLPDTSTKKQLLTDWVNTIDLKELNTFTRTARDLSTMLNSGFGLAMDVRNPNLDLFESLAEKRHVIFFSVNSLEYEQYSHLVGQMLLVLMKQFASAFTEKDNSPKVTFVIDEVNVVANKSLLDGLNKYRSTGIELIIAHQELTQLETPELRDSLKVAATNNTSSKFIFSQSDPSSAEYVSKNFGTRKVLEQTYHTISQKADIGDEGSIKIVDELIAHPNEIKNLTKGQCFMRVKYDDDGVIVWDKLMMDFIKYPEYVVNEEEYLQLIKGNKDFNELFEKFNNTSEVEKFLMFMKAKMNKLPKYIYGKEFNLHEYKEKVSYKEGNKKDKGEKKFIDNPLNYGKKGPIEEKITEEIAKEVSGLALDNI